MLSIFKQHFYHLYHKPTLIQRKTYQPLVKGHNVVGLSPTGSGKTVAFLLPILTNVARKPQTQVVIFEPSQELAIQTSHVAREWANLVHLKVLSLIGGANIRRQKDKLKKRHPQIVVGTPGRIQVLVNSHHLKLGHLQSVVIDEADNLLTGSTLEVIREILDHGPSKVQLSYFSATDTKILHHLKRWFAQDAERIDVRKQDKTRGPVIHGLLRIGMRKRHRMLKMLMDVPHFKALVFFNNLKELNQTYSYFKHLHNHRVAKLAGYQGQIPRAKAMRGFRKNRIQLLLTTDVTARGLDIPELPAVINYDVPKRRTEYIHRIGRTGRMGHRGLVINFGDSHDFRDLRHVCQGLGYHFELIYFYHKQILNRDQLKEGRAKDHRKRKNSKNKGMWHKWRKEDRQH
ncbi:MAG: DEAD/DEAH box helicase [Acetilactobacillus jinshanensis]